MDSYIRKSGYLFYETDVNYIKDSTFVAVKMGPTTKKIGIGINHVQGCVHGCKYPCYARVNSHKSEETWAKPRLVSNALDLLEKDMVRYPPEAVGEVFLCFFTDPFMMGYPEVTEMSLKIIYRLVAAGYRVRTLSKGLTPATDLADNIHPKYRRSLTVGATVTNTDEAWREKWEPRAAPIEGRLKLLRSASLAGFKTWISMEPFPSSRYDVHPVAVLDGILAVVPELNECVFGRWNYHSITDYDHYLWAAKEAKNHCERRGVVCHIKPEVLERRRR